MRTINLLKLVVLLALITEVQAQNIPSSQTSTDDALEPALNEPQSVDFVIWLLDLDENYVRNQNTILPDIYYMGAGGEVVINDIGYSKTTARYEYTGPLPITFYTKETRTDALGESVTHQVPIARIDTLPPEQNSFLFLTSLVNDRSLRMTPLPAFNLQEENGALKVYNLSNGIVAFQMGDERKALEPMKQGIIKIPDNGEFERVRFDMAVYIENESRWRRVYRRNFLLDPKSASVALIYQRTHDGAWRVKTIAKPE